MKSPTIITAFILFALAGTAQAQRVTQCNPATPNSAICIVYAAPTKREDGSNITGALTYRAEQKAGSGSYTSVGAATSATHIYVQNLAPGTYTFRVYAIEGTVSSAASNETGRDVTQAPPNAPVIQVVQVIIGLDHAPVYTIVDGSRRGAEVIGFIPVGSECTGKVAFRFRDQSYRRVSCNDVKTWGVQCRNPAAACRANG